MTREEAYIRISELTCTHNSNIKMVDCFHCKKDAEYFISLLIAEKGKDAKENMK